MRDLRGPVFAVLFFVLGLVLVFRPDLEVFDQADEAQFHLPTIERYAAELPTPDIRHHGAAMGPLYHLAFAVPAAMGAGLPTLRVLTLLLAALGVLVAMRVSVSNAGMVAAAAMALSPYYVGPAVRLSTDDVALALVFATLVLLERGRFAGAVVVSVLAVWTRQIHVWLALPLLARAWGNPARMAAALAPVAALGALVAVWGGLVPPDFQKGHGATLNLDVVVLVLGLLGLYAFFFAPLLWPRLREARRIDLGVSAIVGGLLLAIHPVAYTQDPRRWGGALFSLSGRFPDLFGSDLLLWALVPLGAVTFYLAVRSAWSEGRSTWALALVGFVACNVVSDRAYQKYDEPFLLLALGATLGRKTEHPRAWWGPAVLAGVFLAIDVGRFR